MRELGFNCILNILEIKLKILNQKIWTLGHRTKLWSNVSSATRYLNWGIAFY